MKFQLLIALTIASPFWLSLPVSAQGPSCQRVLMSLKTPKSSKQIKATIANIAKLKLSLDLESATGNQSSPMLVKIMHRHFHDKFEGLKLELQGQLSEAQIKDLIQKEIEKLQTAQNKEAKKDKATRKKQKAEIKVFQLEKLIPNPAFMKTQLRYIDQADVLIGIEGAGVARLGMIDIKTEKYEVIQSQNADYAVSREGDKIYMIDSQGKLEIYDLVNRKLIADRTLPTFEKWVVSRLFDPLQKTLTTLHSNGRIQVQDLLTGDNLASPNVGNARVADFKFISEREMLISIDSRSELYVFNLDTGLTRKIETNEPYSKIFVTPELDKVVLMSESGITVSKVSELNQIIDQDHYLDWPNTNTLDITLTGSDQMLLSGFKKDPTQREESLISLSDLKLGRLVFSEHEREEINVGWSAFSLDANSAFFSVHEAGEFSIEVWRKKVMK